MALTQSSAEGAAKCFLSVSFENTLSPGALLAAKQVWILESPAAHLAVAALGPVAERKEKIDFSLCAAAVCPLCNPGQAQGQVIFMQHISIW